MGRALSFFRNRAAIRDGVIALSLVVAVVLQVTLFYRMPYAQEVLIQNPHLSITLWTYLLAVGSVLPLAVRGRWPASVFVVTMLCAVLYQTQQHPPAVVVAGPLLAMYTTATVHSGRKIWPLIFLGIGLAAAAAAISVSRSEVIVAVVAAFSLLASAALLGGVVRSRRELEAEERRAQQEEDRRHLQEERMRIAREIHDIMGHSLTLMTLQADAGGAALRKHHPDAAESALKVIGETGRNSLRDLRSMLDVITNPREESPFTPVADLRSLDVLVQAIRETGVTVDCLVEGDLSGVPTVAAVSAYRIVQEALTNVVRHSKAELVRVRLAVAADELRLEVADNGGQTGPFVEGRGIRGMKERVAALGGSFEVGEDPNGLFRVAAVIPFTKGR